MLRFALCLAPARSQPTVPGPRRRGTAALGSDVCFVCSSLGEAWAQVKKSLADEAEVHLKFSAKVTPAAPLGCHGVLLSC